MVLTAQTMFPPAPDAATMPNLLREAAAVSDPSNATLPPHANGIVIASTALLKSIGEAIDTLVAFAGPADSEIGQLMAECAKPEVSEAIDLLRTHSGLETFPRGQSYRLRQPSSERASRPGPDDADRRRWRSARTI